MVNHIRTLLLNERPSDVSSWYCDDTFTPLSLSGDMRAFHDILFSGAMSGDKKVDRVRFVIPFASDPEFSDIRSMFDGRTTEDDDTDRRGMMSTVPGFYSGISANSDGDVVVRCVTSPTTQNLFRWSGMEGDEYIGALYRLKEVFNRSKETSRRFAACLLAYVVRLDRMYSRYVRS